MAHSKVSRWSLGNNKGISMKINPNIAYLQMRKII